tara:strand:+ start:664 stop:1410 length:747 start_codon:yes stop_codon:yes gene_type:complete
VDTLEEEFAKVVDSVIDDQEEIVLKELESDATQALLGLGKDADFSVVAPLAALGVSSQKMNTLMDGIYKQAVVDNIQEGYGTSVEEDTKNASVSQNITTVNEFNSTTQKQIVAALATASALTDDSGNGDIDVALKIALAYSLIKSVFNRLRTKRKPLIVDTGVLGAYNLGLFDSSVALEQQDGGRPITKQWLSLRDEKVRMAHRNLDGEKVPVQSAFIYNGIPIRFPKDPLAPPNLTINCRCLLKFSR